MGAQLRTRLVTHAFALLAEVGELADEDVDQDTKVVGVEVLGRARSGEEKVQDLEDQERDT